MLRERVEKYLTEHTTLNLATYGPGGLWACAVLYINDGVNLYFTSVGQTRHGVNINTTKLVSGTVNDDCKSWESMAGVQIGGVVEKVTDLDERRRVVRAYLERFPFSSALWHGEQDVEKIALDPGTHDFYRITPTQLLFTDNAYAPGKREELAFA
jgi:uncharacterized protein YhbP (UPF0306 family)